MGTLFDLLKGIITIMKKRLKTTALLTTAYILGLVVGLRIDTTPTIDVPYDTNAFAGACDITPVMTNEIDITQSDVVVTAEEEPEVVEVYYDEQFCDDLELLALTVYAEAEGESELGKRLVIDTILNRVNSPNFPNSIFEVIYDPKQFDIFENGRLECSEFSWEIMGLIEEEIASQTNHEVLYFNSNGFNDWSTPVLQEGNHYFSK